MDIVLQAKQIERVFKTGAGEDFYALKGVDMQVPRGALTILKGRSGSGKTTLLNILSALDEPTNGDVVFDGACYSDMTTSDKELLRRRNIGFVFQSVALIPVMNAYENVEFAMRLAEIEGEYHEQIMNSLKIVGMDERVSHMPGQMSGGEQQRIAIARAIAHKPKVVFADEPTGALDTESGIRVMKLFKKLIVNEGITIVMTTHDPNLMELGDVIYEMEDGELVETRRNV